METDTLVAIVGAIVGVLGFVWGVYKHYTTRKVARIVYDVSQLADFDVPQSFIQDLRRAPVAISIESAGNKAAENVVLRFKSATSVDEYKVDPSDVGASKIDGAIVVRADKLNPGQRVQLFAFCQGDARLDKVEQLEVSHAEGKGVDKGSQAFGRIGYSSWLGAVEFDTLTASLKVARIGPFHLK